MSRAYNEEESKWKYLVLLGSFINHVIIWGLVYGAGVFQVIFIEEFGAEQSTGSISIVTSLGATLTVFVGPISSILTNRLGCRSVTWIGTIIGSSGLLLTALVTSFWQLYVTFALLGFGFGIAYIPSVVIICQYFDRKRPLATAVACTGLGVGTFIMPQVIRFLVNVYHWRNAALILAAISLNMLVSAESFRHVDTLNGETNQQIQRTNNVKKIIRVKMFKKYSFWCLLVNNFLLLYGMVTFFIHLPAYLRTLDYKDDEGAMFLSLIGIGAIVGRILTGCFAQWLKKPILLYTISLGLAGVTVAVIPFFSAAVPLSIVVTLFGLTSATIGPLLPLIITELLGLDSLSDGYGYILVAEGFGSSLGPPIAGILFDWTGNYILSMVSSGLLMLFASAVMMLPWLIQKMNFQKTTATQLLLGSEIA